MIETRLRALNHKPPLFTDEQTAGATGVVYIARNGKVAVHDTLYVAATSDGGEIDGERREASASAPGMIRVNELEQTSRAAVSQRLADELAHQKTEVVALHVASDPHFALTLGTFMMIDAAVRRSASNTDSSDGSELPTSLSAHAPESRLGAYESGSAARDAWNKLDEGLTRSWADHKEATERFDAFWAVDEEARAAWLGWAIARTLSAPAAGKTGSAFIDHLGVRLEIDMASWWRPTASNYFDRVPKQMTLAALEDVGGDELKLRYGASRKGNLATAAEKLFRGDTIVEAEIKAKAIAWLPPSMALLPSQGGEVLIDAEDDEFAHAA